MALLTPPPAAPQRGDRTTFASRVDAFITWLIKFVTELVSLVANLNSIAAGGAYAVPFKFYTSNSAVGGPNGNLTIGGGAVQNAATYISFDAVDGTGVAVKAGLDDILSSSSRTKGYVRLVKVGDPSAWVRYRIDNWTYTSGSFPYGTVSGVCVGFSSANPFVAGDQVIALFQSNGDKGDKGDTGAAASMVVPTLYVRDEKPQGTNGGALTSGAARTINTTKPVTVGISGAVLSGNRVTVPAGTYNMLASAPALGVQTHRVVLWNVTDNVAYEVGSSEYSYATADGISYPTSRSVVRVQNAYLGTAKTFELRHYFTSGGALDTAGGKATNLVGAEIYAELIFKKVG